MSDHLDIFGAPDLAPGSPARPCVTLAVFAYNQQAYVRAAVEGALAQDYDGPLEIILSDDGSPDETFAVMQEVARGYAGPHHVRLNRNDPNLGLSAHVNRVLAMAQGEIIAVAAGDDISLPTRVTDTVAAFARHPGAMAVSFTDIRMDEAGRVRDTPAPEGPERIIDLEMFLAAGPRAQSRLGLSGASRAFRRTVYERFGDLRPDCPAEDSPYVLRALYLGGLVVCGAPGILYRVHEAQMSSEAGMVRKNEAKFVQQFSIDKELAASHKLIQKKQGNSISKYITEFSTEIERRKIIIMKNKPNIYFLKRFIMSSAYSSREKAGLVKRFFLRKPL